MNRIALTLSVLNNNNGREVPKADLADAVQHLFSTREGCDRAYSEFIDLVRNNPHDPAVRKACEKAYREHTPAGALYEKFGFRDIQEFRIDISTMPFPIISLRVSYAGATLNAAASSGEYAFVIT